MTRIETIENFLIAYEKWGWLGDLPIDDKRLMAAEDALVEATKRLLSLVDGVRVVVHTANTMGSLYFDLVDADDNSVKARVSNHPMRTWRDTPPAWSFDSIEDWNSAIADVQDGLAVLADKLDRERAYNASL